MRLWNRLVAPNPTFAPIPDILRPRRPSDRAAAPLQPITAHDLALPVCGRRWFGLGCGGRCREREVEFGCARSFSGRRGRTRARLVVLGRSGGVVLGLGRTSSGRRGRIRVPHAGRIRPHPPQTLHIREGFGLTRTCSPNPGRFRVDEVVLGPTRTFSGTWPVVADDSLESPGSSSSRVAVAAVGDASR